MMKFATFLLGTSLALGTAANAGAPPVAVAKTATITGVFGSGFDDSGYFFSGTPTTLTGESFVLRFNYFATPDDTSFLVFGANDPRFVSHALTVNGVTISTTNSNRVSNYRLNTNGADGQLQNSFAIGQNNAPGSSRDDFRFEPLVNCSPNCFQGLGTNADYTSQLRSQTMLNITSLAFDANGTETIGISGFANRDGTHGFINSFTVGDTGAVPEPASWAMLIAGFGLTGAVMRRRRVAIVSA
jgi:hypothetical protein